MDAPARLGTTQKSHRFEEKDYEEYERLMKKLAIGIPVRKPRPSSSANRAQIGDVGYMKAGEFHRLFNITKDLTWPTNAEYRSRLYDSPVGSAGLTPIAYPVETCTHESKTYTITHTDDADSVAMLLPISPLYLESIDRDHKVAFERFMKDNLRVWPCPEGITRKELLLVHSRVVTAEWAMVLFKSPPLARGAERCVVLELDENQGPRFCEGLSDSIRYEHGVDISSLLRKNANGTPREPTILPSQCVFLGVFQPKPFMKVSWTVEDTAPTLMLPDSPKQDGALCGAHHPRRRSHR